MTTKRRAFILIFVLGVTTVVTALGLSYISSNGTVMQQATNRYAAIRAQYVAESGAVVASHFVHYPPTTVAYNGVYAGATGVAIDGTYDTVDVTVTPTTPANRYVIRSTSVVRNASGTQDLGKQGIQLEAIVSPEPKWKIAQALLMTGGGWVYSGTAITGAVHSNGNVVGLGTCTGAVTATGAAAWSGGGPPTSVQSGRPAVTAPPFSTALYTGTYKVNNTAYTAYTGWTDGDVKNSTIASLNGAVNSGGTNPGRIVYCKSGDFKVKETVAFTGTLVVRGDCRFDGTNMSVTAVAGYPALVVTGDIRVEQDATVITINGPVLCAGNIDDHGSKNSTLTINGAVILGGGVVRTGSGTTINIAWDSAKSMFWNFAKTANPEPFTLLEWKEN